MTAVVRYVPDLEGTEAAFVDRAPRRAVVGDERGVGERVEQGRFEGVAGMVFGIVPAVPLLLGG